MSRIDNREYYRIRQRQEEAAAEAATDLAARRIHAELAACYEARAGAPMEIEEGARPDAVAA